MKKLLTVDEVAALLGLKRSTIFKLSHRREIPRVKLGSSLRFDPDAIAAWVESKKREVVEKRREDEEEPGGELR